MNKAFGGLPIDIFVVFANERWPFALVWLNSGFEVTTKFNQGNIQQSPALDRSYLQPLPIASKYKAYAERRRGAEAERRLEVD